VTTTLQKLVATGYTARRVITSAALCNTCHDQLGSNPNFHGGDRNDPTACNICHTANRADNGFAVDSSTWIHGIHSASKRTVPFSNGDGDFSTVLYPGQLKNCANCHMPNTVNFGAGSSGQGGGFTGGTLTGNLLWSTVASGKIATPAAASWAVSNPQLAKVTNTTTNTSPYVTTGTNYGNVFTFANASAVLGSVTPSGSTAVATSAVVVTSALGQSIPADGATLVNSPVSSACSACHTDSTAWAHIRSNGGVLYGARSTSLTPYINAAGTLVSPEGCLACHGQGTIMDAAVVHQQQ
jgi:OmcA/MtrC family decaheme c-type cytochrome